MGPELVDINPRELKFTFELKKQSSCSVQLVNKSKDYVAFKVKTTSPKRYCVRPNTGVILPHSTCDFTVTMQAARTAPPDMQLKDKFLVQSTAVPFGTSDEDLIPSFFSKENGRYIEEHKLRVVLVSPPHSPVLHPINGALKQEPAYETLKQEPAYDALKQEPAYEAPKQVPAFEAPVLTESPTSKDRVLTGVGNLIPLHVSTASEAPVLKDTPASKDQALNGVENHVASHVAKDVEDLRMKINHFELKLNEADKMIATQMEEKNIVVEDRDKLQQEIVLLRRKCAARVQVGFPFLFVVFIALVGVALGYLLHK